MRKKVSIFWFRRDLRLKDNAGLYYALKQAKNVLPVFIFDKQILDKLLVKQDKRVDFIHQVLQSLQKQLNDLGSDLIVKKGNPLDVFSQLLQEFDIESVYTNHDYEPYAINRDGLIRNFLASKSIIFHSFKDQVVFDHSEVLKEDGKPYTVFTPYSKKWKSTIKAFYLTSYATEKYCSNFFKILKSPMMSLEDIGFKKTEIIFSPPTLDEGLIQAYQQQRDYPSLSGTSRLSVHLRFGTISIRNLVRKAIELSESWLNELIWREFYMSILFHFPHVVNQSFKAQYDQIEWRNDPKEYEAWCAGKTGYPIVDAGMRELNETGFMHNRVRMIAASFLTKHLLIDWRWGEAYFAEKLIDFDLAANNGGWQWAAGSGCDAAPYFRIFNPYEQTKKFDKDLHYVRRWVPEFEDFHYVAPIVEHKFARERVLAVYKKALQSN